MKREDGDYKLGGCGDDRSVLVRTLVLLVMFASWALPPRGRHRR